MNFLSRFFDKADVEQAAHKPSEIYRAYHEVSEKEEYYSHPFHSDWAKAEEYKGQRQEKFREFIPIGEQLYKTGGEKLMLEVCERVRSISGATNRPTRAS